jgi:transcriptional regulator with XRE-family HTH domain
MDIVELISINLTAWMDSNENLDTAEKLAKKSGVSKSTVLRIKNGETKPTASNLDAIARAFRRQVAELMIVSTELDGSKAFKTEQITEIYSIDPVVAELKELTLLAPTRAEWCRQKIKLDLIEAREKQQEKSNLELSKKALDSPPEERTA